MLLHYDQVRIDTTLSGGSFDEGVKLTKHYLLVQLSDILYFEVLDIPLLELQELRILKLAFNCAANSE
ncbi:UNVERIFIED_CONTAM: Ubiquitin carboxyl-terminal hydrolase 13, partial [Sesamum indicum]